MSTVNISLPREQVHMIDSMVSNYGFANRSEFIRAMIRFLTRKSALVEEMVTFPFVTASQQSAKKIISNFKKTGKYNKNFLKDLEEGLKTSTYFTK